MNKKHIQTTYLKFAVPLVLSSTAFSLMGAEINSITTGKNANGEFEIQILGSDFSGVNSFSLNNPNRIVVDIPNSRSNLAERVKSVSSPIVSDVAVIEGDDRVRATINLSKALPYNVVEGSNKITVVIKPSATVARASKAMSSGGTSSVGFQRGKDGQGKVQILLPAGSNANIDLEKRGTNVVAKLQGSSFGETKRMNVGNFGTPVQSIDVFRNSLNIVADGDFEIVSYQSEDTFSIEFNRPAQNSNQEDLLPGDSKKKYKGEPLSLNFQDIEMRAVLQLIGDFTNTNIAVSDSVQGSITLRMNNVPWDQALDIILQTKGLTMQKNGDVIYIAPSEEIAAARKKLYEISKVDEELAPTRQQLIQIQYARASDILQIIQANSTRNTNDKDTNNGLLTARGSVSVDERTNTLIVKDVPSNIDKVRQLVADLDVPVDQVLIEARIVTASNNFAHDLGIRFGGAFFPSAGSDGAKGRGLYGSGDLNDTTTLMDSRETNLSNRLGVNMAASGETASSFGLSLLGKHFLVDLELSAMQDEGRGEIISSPRVIAQDGGEAEIKQGTEIAYSTTSADGTTTTTWKDIPLKLNVRPKIAPNNQVDMELEISKDAVGNVYNGEYGVDTNQIKTQVLVDSGETVVLGGIYEQSKTKSVSKVPGLGDLPIVGRAFRKDTNSVKKNELLIFVTPKIIDKRYTSRDKFASIRN